MKYATTGRGDQIRQITTWVIINFANPDMVGHTGVENAAIKAIEAVDECVGKAVDAIKEVDGQMFICADHAMRNS